MPAPPPAVLRHEGVVGHEEEGARQDPDHRDHERGEVGDPAAVIVGGRRRRRRKHDVAPLGAVHAADSERAVLVSVVGRPRVRVARGTHGGREGGWPWVLDCASNIKAWLYQIARPEDATFRLIRPDQTKGREREREGCGDVGKEKREGQAQR